MNKSEIAEALLIAFGMVAWPILGKYSQANAAWIGVIVMAGTALVVAALASLQGQFNSSRPSALALLILAIASILNGAAMHRYTIKTSTEGPTGRYLVMVAILVIIEAPLLDFVLNKSALTPRQWLGVACGAACVYLIKPT